MAFPPRRTRRTPAGTREFRSRAVPSSANYHLSARASHAIRPAMLAIDNIVVRIAGREILSGATANLPAGRRIGLVGRNGAGKTTLFKVILGQLHQDDGDVSWPSAWRVGAVAQEAPGTDVSLLDTVLEADQERTKLLADAEHETDGHKLGDIYHRLEAIDAYTAPARAAEILAGVGFTAEDLLRPCREFSGGWRVRG